MTQRTSEFFFLSQVENNPTGNNAYTDATYAKDLADEIESIINEIKLDFNIINFLE